MAILTISLTYLSIILKVIEADIRQQTTETTNAVAAAIAMVCSPVIPHLLSRCQCASLPLIPPPSYLAIWAYSVPEVLLVIFP